MFYARYRSPVLCKDVEGAKSGCFFYRWKRIYTKFLTAPYPKTGMRHLLKLKNRISKNKLSERELYQRDMARAEAMNKFF